MIEDYFQQVEGLIAAADIIHSSSITYDKRSTYVGFIRGEIYFLDGSLLHVREFINVEHGIERYMYAYHYQRSDGGFVFRYDNTPHFPALPTSPHHKHEAGEANIVAASPLDLQAILAEIQVLITTPVLEVCYEAVNITPPATGSH